MGAPKTAHVPLVVRLTAWSRTLRAWPSVTGGQPALRKALAVLASPMPPPSTKDQHSVRLAPGAFSRPRSSINAWAAALAAA
ncbi:hypothetical protein D1F64_12985 [Breoghania sp. L-A4]|nr:hypothetical protein D1F64_12985 [Breoghania sp. L-A4]